MTTEEISQLREMAERGVLAMRVYHGTDFKGVEQFHQPTTLSGNPTGPPEIIFFDKTVLKLTPEMTLEDDFVIVEAASQWEG